ncbi:MAG: hypothetical protein SFY70_08195 [Bacteroidia bacterium]|nr:hypothetical protein [Bacteroidia bacterium]
MPSLYRAPRSWHEAVLRLAVLGTFVGHGTLCFTLRADWAGFLTYWGVSLEAAQRLMPVIGALDWLIGLSALVRPVPVLLLYGAGWAFLAALMRPLTGQSWLEFVERAANWGAPLALWLLVRYSGVSSKSRRLA